MKQYSCIRYSRGWTDFLSLKTIIRNIAYESLRQVSYFSLPILVLLVKQTFMEYYVILYKICFNMKKITPYD